VLSSIFAVASVPQGFPGTSGEMRFPRRCGRAVKMLRTQRRSGETRANNLRNALIVARVRCRHRERWLDTGTPSGSLWQMMRAVFARSFGNLLISWGILTENSKTENGFGFRREKILRCTPPLTRRSEVAKVLAHTKLAKLRGLRLRDTGEAAFLSFPRWQSPLYYRRLMHSAFAVAWRRHTSFKRRWIGQRIALMKKARHRATIRMCPGPL
jgi:hypothetical protein